MFRVMKLFARANSPKAEMVGMFTEDPMDVVVFAVNRLSMKGSAYVGTESGPGSYEIDFRFGNRALMDQATMALRERGHFSCIIAKEWIMGEEITAPLPKLGWHPDTASKEACNARINPGQTCLCAGA